jgi:hypothetical protein
LGGVDGGQLDGPLPTARVSARVYGQELATINSKATHIVAPEAGDFRRGSLVMNCVVLVLSCNLDLFWKGKTRS